MTRTSLALLALLAAACSAESPTNPDTVPAVTESEAFVLSETARFAGMLNVKVRGEITDYLYAVDCPGGGAPKGCVAFGWYHRGTAYYHRPSVGRYPDQLTAVAAHEVCHAVSLFHDRAHWCCQKKLGVQPTYPFPVAIQGEPVCK